MIKHQDNPVINKAVHVIVDMSRDTQLRERARIRERALHDEVSLLKEATHKCFYNDISKGMRDIADRFDL